MSVTNGGTAPKPFSMVVTHVHLAPDGDAWFPDLDWSAWAEVSREAYDGYDIATYDRA